TLTWLLVGRPLARSYGVLPRTVRPLRLNRLRDCTYEEECANNFVNDLIQGALAEDVNVATEDVTFYESDEDSVEDDVFSLADPSEDEEDREQTRVLAKLSSMRVRL
ncbi:unnamed protein product, partial [Symbiodinium necroappetens]